MFPTAVMGAHTLSLNPQPPYMKSLSFKLSPSLTFSPPSKLRPFCSLTLIPNSHGTSETEPNPTTTKRGLSKSKSKVADAAGLKQTWLDSISCPFLDKTHFNWDSTRVNDGSHWVIGIDPDVSGALALLKTDHSGFSAQVFDSPNLRVRVGKGLRKRLDTKAIVQMIQRLEVPMGTSAFIEQSIPYPQDGKQGWYSGGFGYGLWIGILVASGFSVVPVPSLAWKNEFKLASGRSTKAGNVYFLSLLKLVIEVAAEIYGDSPLDDNRRVASTLFPSMSSLLQRKKDHGRAEALLIAAYGRGQELKLDSSVGMNYTAEVVNPVDSPPLHISVGEC